MKIFTILIFAFFINIVNVWADEKVLLDLPSGLVDLVKPIVVEKANIFDDGGTIGMKLKDATGNQFLLCLDGRMQFVPWWKALINFAREPQAIYVNATHPTADGAVKIPVGGFVEKQILSILEQWLTSLPKSESMPPEVNLVSGVIKKLKER